MEMIFELKHSTPLPSSRILTFLCCFLFSTIVLANDSQIKLEMRMAHNSIKASTNISVIYQITNIGDIPLSDISLLKDQHLFVKNSEVALSSNNKFHQFTEPLLPGQTFHFQYDEFFKFQVGAAYVLSGAVTANHDSNIISAADAKLVYAFGINMDVTVNEECGFAGEEIGVNLISRLLIQEDAAKTPGSTIINVGGIDIEILLPASQWEARNLVLTTTTFNDGNVFDPFTTSDPTLTNFCEQANVDGGRNLENVLDECETIETVRAPCTMIGEDDDMCEFPDWVFCHNYLIPSDYSETSLTITASDDFEVWQAVEITPGTGNYGDFIDVTEMLESGSTDEITIEVKFTVPVELSDFIGRVDDDFIAINWKTQQETNNSHFILEKSQDGKLFHELDKIPGKGNSTEKQEYFYVDLKPYIGINFYKLSQVDYDGNINQYDIISVAFQKNNLSLYTFYPNPAEDFLHFQSLIGHEFNSIYVYDILGKPILNEPLTSSNQINISQLLPGKYFLKVFDQNKNEIGFDSFVKL